MTPRFYIAPTEAAIVGGATLQLPERAAAHAVRVLRLAAGDALTLFDGGGSEYGARIGMIERGRVSIQVLAQRDADRESPLRITLLQGIARGERMDFIVQKSTELGVQRIQPLFTTRATVKLDAAGAARRVEHWQGVAASACEQCGRNRLPQIDAPAKLHDALGDMHAPLRLLLDPDGATTLRALPLTAATAVALLIGPEGGLDDTERAAAAARGFVGCRMGPRVLRTETAPLAAIAALQALAGDFG